MGRRLESAYLSTPEADGPAVVVIQEWWGLVPHIENVCDRFAKEGFIAIAPDLYHGATPESPDEAQRMLMELDIERAEREIAAAGEYALSLPQCHSGKYGVVGFCMGGALAQYTASKEARVGAAVSFYGGFKRVTIDWTSLAAPLLLIYAANDKGVPPDHGRELSNKLEEMEKRVELVIYPDADHGFFNDTRPRYNVAAAADAWKRTIAMFRKYLLP